MYYLKVAFGVAAAAFLAWGGLNTSGFCFAEMRYVPDNELFARYLESNSVWLQPQLIQVQSSTGDPTVESYETFKSGMEYIQKYPDCCSYGPKPGVLPDSDYPPTIFQQFFGQVWGLVALRYRLQYVDGSGKTKTHQWFGEGWADSCGRRVWHY
jgi:hypothetical protein